MKVSFSFSEKSVIFILQRFPLLLPGIEKVVSIYYDSELGCLNAHTLRKEKNEYLLEETPVNDANGKIQKFRRDSSPFLWMQPEDVPFEISNEERIQLSIFNELNNNILLFRISNEFDGLQDLFFLYFKSDLSNFGIANSKRPLTTEIKSVIGHLVKNAVETFIQNFKEDRELFISFSETNQTVINELSHSRKELAITREKNKDGIIHLCKSYMVDLSRESGYNFLFSDEAIRKLKEYDGELGSLRIILEKSAQYAQTMQINRNLKDIVISDYHLIFISRNKKNIETEPGHEQTSEIPARYSKTFLFLNKLENAAQTVKLKNLLLTGINVGNEFPSPITPSAITDALKNHQSKILYLFKELPHRWQIIRSEFRPVQNILNPRQERQKHTG